MPTIIQFRRGSHTYMSGEGSQLVLLEGEPFLEYPDAGIGIEGSKLKIGDGVSKYCDLPYLVDTSSIIPAPIDNTNSEEINNEEGVDTSA